MANHQKFQFRLIGKYLFRHRLPLETETNLFILVSVLDIIMTWILISRGGFVESNPVANYFLLRWGKNGLVGFKFCAVLVVCLATQLIALKRIQLARLVLVVGIAVVSFVVIYSLSLYLKSGHGVSLVTIQ